VVRLFANWNGQSSYSCPQPLEVLAVFADAKIAVLEAFKPDVETLPPAQRRKFAELCRQWADLADPGSQASEPSPRVPPPVAGVLLELNRGLRGE
jgi:hypothetical protein